MMLKRAMVDNGMARRFVRCWLLGMGSLAACACSAAEPSAAAEPDRPITSLADIAGSWDIASFDGYAPVRLHDGVRRAFVEVGRDRLAYVIECNYSGNPARLDSAGVLHDTGDGTRMQTLMGCDTEGAARDRALFGFFGTKPKVSWGEGGRLRMTNGRSELILERPEVRRLAHVPAAEELIGRWIPQMALRLEGTGHSGWGFQQPSVLTFAPGRIAYSGCDGFALSVRYEAGGKLATQDRPAPPSCGRDSESARLVKVLQAGPLVERMAGGGLVLTAGEDAITLQSEAYMRRLRGDPPLPPSLGSTVPPPPPPPPRGG